MPWTEQEQAENEAAYDRMKDELDATYPVGQYVAFGHGKIIGDSADFFQLIRMIQAQGRDPREVMVVLIGDEEPRASFLPLVFELAHDH